MSKFRYTRGDVRERLSEIGSQEDIGKLIGNVSQQTVHDTLSGKTKGKATRWALARLAGFDPADVDWEDPDPTLFPEVKENG